MGPDGGAADDPGFEVFYRHWVPQLRRFLIWLEADPSILEDAIQETMISAAKFWPTLRASVAPRAWLFMVAQQRLSDQRVKRRAGSLTGDVPEAGERANTSDLVDERLTIVEWVRKLPAHQIAPVVLHFYGFTDREIAQIAGIAPASARSYRSLGIAALRQIQATSGEEGTE